MDRPALWVNATEPTEHPPVLLLAASPVPRGTFTHIAGTYDGAVARLYVDGVLKSSVDILGSFGADDTPLLLGANGNNLVVSERFPGRIDEIALYDRALDSVEIAQLAAGALFSFTGSRTDAAVASDAMP